MLTSLVVSQDVVFYIFIYIRLIVVRQSATRQIARKQLEPPEDNATRQRNSRTPRRQQGTCVHNLICSKKMFTECVYASIYYLIK